MIRWDDTHADQVAALSDAELPRAYQRAIGEPGDQAADALLAEIERRGLALTCLDQHRG